RSAVTCCLIRVCGDPRIHSFPARRSSDLGDHHGGNDGSEYQRVADAEHAPARRRRRLRAAAAAQAEGAAGEQHATGCRQFGPELDRKSTRLNSSHVKISYAVFCLKKKNSL